RRREPVRKISLSARDGGGSAGSDPAQAQARIQRSGAVLVSGSSDELCQSYSAGPQDLVPRVLSGGLSSAGPGSALSRQGESPIIDLEPPKLRILEPPLHGWGWVQPILGCCSSMTPEPSLASLRDYLAFAFLL